MQVTLGCQGLCQAHPEAAVFLSFPFVRRLQLLKVYSTYVDKLKDPITRSQHSPSSLWQMIQSEQVNAWSINCLLFVWSPVRRCIARLKIAPGDQFDGDMLTPWRLEVCMSGQSQQKSLLPEASSHVAPGFCADYAQLRCKVG
jgi:hypothetical protein